MSEFQPEFEFGKSRKLIFTIAGIILLIVLFVKSAVTIEQGHAGLLYHTFGAGINNEEAPLGQGFHFVAPWNNVIDYEIRQRELTEPLQVLSSNLLNIELDMSVFYQPIYSQLANLEIERSNYQAEVVVPVIRSVAREVIAKYIPEEINTTKREQIEKEIFDEAKSMMGDNYVQLNNILIRNIKLPKTLEVAIESKLKQEQEALEYEFKIQKEVKEAERKRQEAQGIADFQQKVNQGLTPAYLTWKGIEATENLAKSPNSKTVVVGSGKNGLPLILGGSN